ncbi:dihydroorotate dehydrogenase electron transfer subunit, partial [Clostridia bacterium OttesenSCG-928-F22]|nr:dihydroorotate dehydrogenase electron transfer subunit [Clostridia bacterium OttesenSCG-928-F22]
ELDIMGPLGNSFLLPEGITKVALVGGGVGVAPLELLAKANPQVEFTAYLGFRDKSMAYHIEAFEELCSEVFVATEDGSLGHKGYVTELLASSENKAQLICACGPTAMLKSLQNAAGDIPCLVSLEERMGCGVGACRACVCGMHTDGGTTYKRVCWDGPVFPLSEVAL